MRKKIKQLPIIRMLSRFVFACFACLPAKKKLVVFESFSGKQYSCNPRAIYEYMRSHDMPYELVWSVNKDNIGKFEAQQIPYVRRLSLKWFYYMARAGFWVTNSRMPNWVPKPAHTTYVQTWHGTPLKKLVGDMEQVRMPGISKSTYIKSFQTEASHWDYLISPNPYSTAIFKRAFAFNKQVLETGYPRNDILYQEDLDEASHRLRKKYGIANGKKVILYAPTWRDHQHYGLGAYKFDLQLDLDELFARFGNDSIILLRLHSFIKEQFDLDAYGEFVKDVSAFHDINELYLLSDLLITDYSSVFFDYANTRKPIIFFVYDLEEYRDEVRGFYFDLEAEAPGPVVRTTAQVAAAIEQLSAEGIKPYKEKYEAFIQRFCYMEDGNAASRVVTKVFKEEGF